MSTPAKRASTTTVASGHLQSIGVRDYFIFAALTLVTLILFWPISGHEFLNYDDPDYITANPIVQAGLTWEGVKWAATSGHAYNWHPMTWVSHMFDVQLFGLNAGKHHLASLFWHLANVLLLFWLLRKTTKAVWPSALVAGVFAWHPMHVESVAWACERKDVLSTFFWLLTTLYYVRYVEKARDHVSAGRVDYFLALTFFALGLMSKPMLVTLPFTLLLLDYWPLQRFGSPAGFSLNAFCSRLWQLFREKLPFFALTIVSCIITFLVQRKGGAVVTFEHLPLGSRLANVFVSYVRYIGKTLLPSDLTIYYQPTEWSTAQVAMSLALLLAISALAIWLSRKQPFVLAGWLWFLGTLVPVIGIVQVGAQAIADRYMYVPMIGLSIALIWPFVVLATKQKKAAFGAWVVGIALLSGNVLATARQIGYWRNSETIFARAITIDPKNMVARVMLANTLLEQQRFHEAEEQLKAALRVNPNFPEIHFNLGNLFVHQNRTSEAITAFEAAIQRNPDYPEAHANLAVALGMERRFQEAITHYERSLSLQPNQPDLMRNLALDLIALKRFSEAMTRLEQALQMDPSDATAHFLIGTVHQAQGETKEAIFRYGRALELRPAFPEARERLMALHEK